MKILPSVGPAAILALLPSLGWGGSVYLNGVNIDGVTNQKFEKATVKIDEKGAIFIDAPGYAVKSAEGAAKGSSTAAAPDASPPRLTKRYWLVTEQTALGMTEFDIDVYINAKWIRKLKSQEEQIVTEITRHLTPGRNTVLLTAHKIGPGPPKSFARDHVFRVIIGEGNVGGDNVMIDNPILKFERSAAEAQDVSQEYTLVTR